MSTSIFTLFTLVHCATVVIAFGAAAEMRRRLRDARVVQSVIAGIATVLVPLNLYCALDDHHGTAGAGVDGLVVTVAVLNVAGLCAILVLTMSRRIPRLPARLPRRVLAVGAHPDDLELACGGTIARLADSGHEVHALVMSAGGRGGDAGVRPDEAIAGGAFLGVAKLQVLDFTDTRLSDHESEMADAIEAAIRRFNPDIIFTHSANDQHQDHRAVHLATLRAARRHPAILCYESPSVTRDFLPSVFVDIEDYVDVKVAAVGVHYDQKLKPYMEPERVRGLAVHRGGQAKVRYAEGFEPVRMLASPAVEL